MPPRVLLAGLALALTLETNAHASPTPGSTVFDVAVVGLRGDVIRHGSADNYYGRSSCTGWVQWMMADPIVADTMSEMSGGVRLISYESGCGIPHVRYFRLASNGEILTDVMLNSFIQVK